MNQVFWFLVGVWMTLEVSLWFGAWNEGGGAMPMTGFVFWALAVGGLSFFLALHIAIRVFSKGD